MKIAYKNLKKLCRTNDITLGQLEKELSIGVGTLKKWAKAKNGPNVMTVKKVCDYFGITIDELMKEW